MATSRKEKKRVLAKKRRQRISSDPVQLAEENAKRRARYAKNKKVRETKNAKMTDRQIRTQRRKWREAKRKQKVTKNAEKPKLEVVLSAQAKSGKSRKDRRKSKCYRDNVKLELQNIKLRAKAEKYKHRYYRLRDRVEQSSNSPQSLLNKQLKKDKERISPKVKKQLLFGKAMAADVKSMYSDVKSKKDFKKLRSHLKLKYVKKYHFMSVAKPFVPMRSMYNLKRSFGVRKKIALTVEARIQAFFERDDVSTLAPGVRDVITQQKIKKQKRYLSNTLLFLHHKFCEENEFVVSYTTFCKFRPFHVVFRKVDQRDTCICIRHENMHLLHNRLAQLKIIEDKNLDTMIYDDMCCANASEACLLRKCELCQEKFITCALYEDEDSYYDQWISKGEESRDKESSKSSKSFFRKTEKTRIFCKTHAVVDEFFRLLDEYMKHLHYIRHQYRVLTDVKKNLADDEVFFLIDFSENWNCKLFREVQAFHFGGNRKQISIHTVMIYKGNGTEQPMKEAVATVTEDLNHKPEAIFMHLLPLLNENCQARKVHIMSDSPSSQYRNKSMFYVIYHYIVPIFKNLEIFTWNFSETGHGKGPADGIGATVKRTLNRVVANGRDISNVSDLMKAAQENLQKTRVIHIDNAQNEKVAKGIKSAVQLKGTMKVHQVVWRAARKIALEFRSLSCFTCAEKCEHYLIGELIFETEENCSPNASDVELDAAESTIDKEREVAEIDFQPVVSSKDVAASVETYNVDDWVVAKLEVESRRGKIQSAKYIGKIIELNNSSNEDFRFKISFLMPKKTKIHPGYIFKYPDKPDIWDCDEGDLLYKVEAPEYYQRALKFSVHVDNL